MDADQRIRAAALEAASRIVAGNLSKFVNLGRLEDNRKFTELATLGLAKEFEQYVRGETA